MSWQSDAFDWAFDVEQDQDLEEDFKETESLPVQKKMKKNASAEKPCVWHVLNKAEKSTW